MRHFNGKRKCNIAHYRIYNTSYKAYVILRFDVYTKFANAERKLALTLKDQLSDQSYPPLR